MLMDPMQYRVQERRMPCLQPLDIYRMWLATLVLVEAPYRVVQWGRRVEGDQTTNRKWMIIWDAILLDWGTPGFQFTRRWSVECSQPWDFLQNENVLL